MYVTWKWRKHEESGTLQTLNTVRFTGFIEYLLNTVILILFLT